MKTSQIARMALQGHSHHPVVNSREIALRHARIIQHRKDIRHQILASVVLLSQYPRHKGAEYSASDPADLDVADFKAHIRFFQPGDYDDLIEERNANLLCGYALCPCPKPAPSKGGPWKLINLTNAKFDIIDRRESERWCSDDCKRRALYVRLQLNETAAWERVALPDIDIELLEEGGFLEHLGRHIAGTKQKSGIVDNSASLALEREVVGTAGIIPPMAQLTVKERNVAARRVQDGDPSEDDAVDFVHLIIEGYEPRTGKHEAET